MSWGLANVLGVEGSPGEDFRVRDELMSVDSALRGSPAPAAWTERTREAGWPPLSTLHAELSAPQRCALLGAMTFSHRAGKAGGGEDDGWP